MIDVQVGVVAQAHDRDQVVAKAALAVRRAREAGVPVLWIQHRLGVGAVFLAGASTKWCIRATA